MCLFSDLTIRPILSFVANFSQSETQFDDLIIASLLVFVDHFIKNGTNCETFLGKDPTLPNLTRDTKNWLPLSWESFVLRAEVRWSRKLTRRYMQLWGYNAEISFSGRSSIWKDSETSAMWVLRSQLRKLSRVVWIYLVVYVVLDISLRALEGNVGRLKL